MKKISLWAKCHPAGARFLIVIIKVLQVVLAIYAGMSLARLEIKVSENVFPVSIIGFIITAFVYSGLNIRSYSSRKICDMLLIACTFTAILAISNNSFSTYSYAPVMASSVTSHPTPQTILESLKYRDKNSLTHQEKRILKKEFFRQVKKYSVAKIMNDEEKSSQAVLIILTIIAAVGLTFLLGALVCSIACNSSEILALIVGVIGLGGLIWGSIAVINAIKKKQRKKVTTPEASQ